MLKLKKKNATYPKIVHMKNTCYYLISVVYFGVGSWCWDTPLPKKNDIEI